MMTCPSTFIPAIYGPYRLPDEAANSPVIPEASSSNCAGATEVVRRKFLAFANLTSSRATRGTATHGRRSPS